MEQLPLLLSCCLNKKEEHNLEQELSMHRPKLMSNYDTKWNVRTSTKGRSCSGLNQLAGSNHFRCLFSYVYNRNRFDFLNCCCRSSGSSSSLTIQHAKLTLRLWVPVRQPSGGFFCIVYFTYVDEHGEDSKTRTDPSTILATVGLPVFFGWNICTHTQSHARTHTMQEGVASWVGLVSSAGGWSHLSQ